MSSVQKRAADDRPGSRVLVVVLCVVAVLLSGCDTLNWQQYKISGIHAHSADADRLESVVIGIAGRYALTDATQTSHVQDTLVLVTEPDVSLVSMKDIERQTAMRVVAAIVLPAVLVSAGCDRRVDTESRTLLRLEDHGRL